MTAKVKYADFQLITRSRSLAEPVASEAELRRIALELLRPCFSKPRPHTVARGHDSRSGCPPGTAPVSAPLASRLPRRCLGRHHPDRNNLSDKVARRTRTHRACWPPYACYNRARRLSTTPLHAPPSRMLRRVNPCPCGLPPNAASPRRIASCFARRAVIRAWVRAVRVGSSSPGFVRRQSRPRTTK